MAADGTNYNGRKQATKLDGAVTEHAEALWLGLTMSQAKSRFYLDYIYEVNADGVIGFLGGCEVGSANYQRHSTTRIGTLKVTAETVLGNGVFREFRLYTDGGINTKGFVYNNDIVSQVIFDMQISAEFKSSYHAVTTSYGFRGRQRNAGNTDWEAWNYIYLEGDYGAIPKDSQLTVTSYGFGSIRRFTEYQIQPFIINEEGTYFGDITNVMPKAKPVTFYSPSGVTYYIDTPDIEVGTRMYTGDDFNGQLSGPTGTGDFYISSTLYWRYGYDVFLDDWVFLELIDTSNPGGGGTPPTAFNYKGYSDISSADAANQVVYGANQNVGTLYFNDGDGRWYQNYSGTSTTGYSFSNIAPDGYYADGDLSGVTQEKYLIDGFEQ